MSWEIKLQWYLAFDLSFAKILNLHQLFNLKGSSAVIFLWWYNYIINRCMAYISFNKDTIYTKCTKMKSFGLCCLFHKDISYMTIHVIIVLLLINFSTTALWNTSSVRFYFMQHVLSKTFISLSVAYQMSSSVGSNCYCAIIYYSLCPCCELRYNLFIRI